MKGSTDNKPEEFPSVRGSCPHPEVGFGICLPWMSSEYILNARTQLSRKSKRIAGHIICLYRIHLPLMSYTCMHMIFVQVDNCLV